MGLTDNKVNILDDSGEYKSTYQILKEIASVWKEMTSLEQSSILKSLFGARQANIGAAILNNFDIAEAAYEASLKSAGSAMAEHSKYLESLDARINQFKAAWQSLSEAILSSDFLGDLIDSGTALLGILESIVETIGPGGLLGIITALGVGIKNFGNSNELAHHGCESMAA